MSSGLFKKCIYKMNFTNHIYLVCVKQDLALNNQQWLIYNKTKANSVLMSCHCKRISISLCLSTQLVIVTRGR